MCPEHVVFHTKYMMIFGTSKIKNRTKTNGSRLDKEKGKSFV
jgi:hypothetical protein